MKKITNYLKPIMGLIMIPVLALAMVLTLLPSMTNAEALTRQLELGSRGSDVSTLQTFLAQDNTIYPQGLVTGYFGSLTKSAVSNFQAANGIQTAGRVGPATLPVINRQMLEGVYVTGIAPIITSSYVSNISRNNATINWSTNENANGKVYYSTIPFTLVDHENSVDVNGSLAMTDMNYRTSQNLTLQNLSPNTTYYYLVYVTGQTGFVSITWPSTFTTPNY